MKKVWNNKTLRYIDLNTKTIGVHEIKDYLTDNPTHYVFDGINKFVLNVFGQLSEVKCSNHLQKFEVMDHELNLTNRWFILKPCSFIKAIKAWDSGFAILRKGDNLISPTTYVNNSKIDLDEIFFNGSEILIGQWFIYEK